MHDDSERAPQGEHVGAASNRRVLIGKLLVGTAVLAPALLVVGVYLILQGRLYGYHFKGPLWPWFTADAALLVSGMLLLRGQDL